MLYNSIMSKRNTILSFLVPTLVLAVFVAAGFYFYYKNDNTLTKEQIEAMQREELMRYSIDPSLVKSEEEQRKELQSFTINKNVPKLTEEEMRAQLTIEE